MPATEAFKGRSFTLYLGDAGSPEAFTLLQGVRSTQMTINNEPVDITNNGSEGIRELLQDAGPQGIDVACEGLVNNADVFKEVMAICVNRQKRRYQVRSGMGDIIEFDAVIASAQRNGETNGVETFTFNLQSTFPLIWQLAT